MSILNELALCGAKVVLVVLVGCFICLFARFLGIKESLMSQFYQSLKISSTQKLKKKNWPQYRCVILCVFY